MIKNRAGKAHFNTFCLDYEFILLRIFLIQFLFIFYYFFEIFLYENDNDAHVSNLSNNVFFQAIKLNSLALISTVHKLCKNDKIPDL